MGATVEAAVPSAAQTPTPAPPVPTADTAEADVLPASTLTEPSPAQTPLVPPPGVQPNGTVAAPEPTPATEASPLPPEPYADELPPDFWGDALEPPTSSAPSSTVPTDESDAPPPAIANTPSASLQNAAKPLDGSLQNDPRFVLLTELFPGRISDWQSAEPVDAAPDTGADAADDAAGNPETVDLEAGLDADETAGDAD